MANDYICEKCRWAEEDDPDDERLWCDMNQGYVRRDSTCGHHTGNGSTGSKRILQVKERK